MVAISDVMCRLQVMGVKACISNVMGEGRVVGNMGPKSCRKWVRQGNWYQHGWVEGTWKVAHCTGFTADTYLLDR